MAVHVAFLRAINLGATRKFPKDAIRAATEAAGFTGVETHINTGNVRLETRMRSRARIERALEQSYAADRGFEVPTIVFTAAELRAIAEEAGELSSGHTGRHYVSLLKQAVSAEVEAEFEALSTDTERLFVRDRAVHLLVAENYMEAKVTNAAVEKKLGVATNRNLTVISALAQKWC